jgi:hypothetical protein
LHDRVVHKWWYLKEIKINIKMILVNSYPNKKRNS